MADASDANGKEPVLVKEDIYHSQHSQSLQALAAKYGQKYYDLEKGSTARGDLLKSLGEEFQKMANCYDAEGVLITDTKHYYERAKRRINRWKPKQQTEEDDKVSVVSLDEDQTDLKPRSSSVAKLSGSGKHSKVGGKKSKEKKSVSRTSAQPATTVDIFANLPPNLKEKLLCFGRIVESEDFEGYVKTLAAKAEKKKDTDNSCTLINQALQIFLTDDKANGNAQAYKAMKKLYPAKEQHLFLSPKEIMEVARAMAVTQDPSLATRKCANLSLLVGYEGKRGPQPTHVDTKHPLQGEAEKFCILMLNKNRPGTIYYDMDGVSDLPPLEEIREVWEDAPESLWDAIENHPSALKLLRECGRLLFATPDERMERGIVPQFDLTILSGSHPHCAPACDQFRAVLFYTFGEGYNGDTQISREKLPLLLYEELRGAEAERPVRPGALSFLVDKYLAYCAESAKFGAKDDTFVDLPSDWEKAHRLINNSAATTGVKWDARQIKLEKLRLEQQEFEAADQEYKKAELDLADRMEEAKHIILGSDLSDRLENV